MLSVVPFYSFLQNFSFGHGSHKIFQIKRFKIGYIFKFSNSNCCWASPIMFAAEVETPLMNTAFGCFKTSFTLSLPFPKNNTFRADNKSAKEFSSITSAWISARHFLPDHILPYRLPCDEINHRTIKKLFALSLSHGVCQCGQRTNGNQGFPGTKTYSFS